MEVVIWSFIVIAISVGITQVMRIILRKVLQQPVFKILDEFLAAMQCSIGILECGVVSGVVGPWSWISLSCTFLFGTVKHYTFIKGKYVGNPVGFIDRYYMAGKKCLYSPLFIVTTLAAQVGGALFAHSVSKLFWGRMTYSLYHNNALLMNCKTTLEVSCMYGFGVEFITTFLAWSADSITPIKFKPPIRSAVSISLVLSFLKKSGSWMNPALASAHTWNCSGHDNYWEHFIIYWLAPYMAAIVFYELKELSVTVSENKRKAEDSQAINTYSGVDTNGVVCKPMETHFHAKNLDIYKTTLNGSFQKNGVAPQRKLVSNGLTESSGKSTKYHRSPGGSLRSRVSSIGPG